MWFDGIRQPNTMYVSQRPKEGTGQIYAIRNTENDKVYVGQTKCSLTQRMNVHKKQSERNKRKTCKLCRAMEEIGVDRFFIEPLETDVPICNLDKCEEKWIVALNSCENGYNCNHGGKGKAIFREDDLKMVISLFERGVYQKDIAKMFGVSEITIMRLLHDNGIWKEGSKTITKDLLFCYIMDGLSNSEIAKKHNVRPETVARLKRKYGLRNVDLYGDKYYGHSAKVHKR